VLTFAILLLVSHKRSTEDLDIHVGSHKAFEWYWNRRDEMPGLDAYEDLDPAGRAGILAAFEHWGNIAPGEHPLESRVNEENARPPILAVKAGVHRFPAFHAGNDVWIVTGYYKKEGRKLDKPGKREIRRAITAYQDYGRWVKQGIYYERK
jgi:hypothetical protein